MQKHKADILNNGIAIVFVMVAMLFFSACTPSHKEVVDELNSLSYAFHYRNLDSTKVLAERALRFSEDYPAGYAEACNNLAFVSIAKMNYKQAKRWLDSVEERSDNQIELLIADVQNMRLCQRESRNKDFYSYREKALVKLRRIAEEADNLPQREHQRAVYAKSEFAIVAATYFYYVQLEKPMLQALNTIDPDELEQDTAQYLNYLYNFGSGGALTQGTPNEISQHEFDDLIQCYMVASGSNPFPYWQANALQAISEHIQDAEKRKFLIQNNLPAFQYLNVEQMPDSLLAGNLAQRALNLFTQYGDVYQIAGANRTLAECYWQIHDYASAASCLNHALRDNSAIHQAPDLVASIRERLSLVFSAVDDKPKSDYNRNIYLDLQEQSRQDRQLEARASQLDATAVQLNTMIVAVVGMIVIVVVLLYVFDRMKRKKASAKPMDEYLEPLREWSRKNTQEINELSDKKEEIDEAISVARIHIVQNKKRNLEQRAKVALVNSITPFIDRMSHEVTRLLEGKDSDEVRQERYEYISELTDKINQYNRVLTEWIQMRQGTLSLRIESFRLQPLFDIMDKGKQSFSLKGISLEVEPTDAVVKADRTLTLFMINTIADNARKFTPSGGKVKIMAHVVKGNQAKECKASSDTGYVEIAIEDTGKGMDQQMLSHVFDRTYTGGHGFGLLNCKGIIEKYRKLSSIFSVCNIQAESDLGKGSRFRFRLPIGMLRAWAALVLVSLTLLTPSRLYAHKAAEFNQNQNMTPVSPKMSKPSMSHHQHDENENLHSIDLMRADAFADSAYFSNINGTYERTLGFADSARFYLNRHYLSIHPDGKFLMVQHPQIGMAAELIWLHDNLPTNYNVILDLRNETAIAALALHKWALYESNNKVYTQLFRERSADRTLPEYVRTMQMSKNSKMVSIILLVILLLQLPVAYYFLYYRHVLSYKFALEKLKAINKILLGNDTDTQKLAKIRNVWDVHRSVKSISPKLSDVVDKIESALCRSINQAQKEDLNIELATDELHRMEYENDKLHISNSVLDNCLSTVKHETMYYPSRIRQLIDLQPEDLASLRELVDYYHSLYTMLSAQAMEQVEANIKYDDFFCSYLYELMKGHSHKVVRGTRPASDVKYAIIYVEQQDVKYDEKLHKELFTPLTSDLNYLLARQIVREMGEVTNLRGCGITAKCDDKGCLLIEAVVPHKVIGEVM